MYNLRIPYVQEVLGHFIYLLLLYKIDQDFFDIQYVEPYTQYFFLFENQNYGKILYVLMLLNFLHILVIKPWFLYEDIELEK